MPSTALQARTGELTPPGITFAARLSRRADLDRGSISMLTAARSRLPTMPAPAIELLSLYLFQYGLVVPALSLLAIAFFVKQTSIAANRGDNSVSLA